MQPIIFTVDKSEFAKAYLTLFVGLANLTDSEIKMLEQILNKQSQLIRDGLSGIYLSKILFSSESRKEMRENMKCSYQSFNNCFKGLKDKGLIKGEEGSYVVDEILIPRLDVNFKFDIK